MLYNIYQTYFKGKISELEDKLKNSLSLWQGDQDNMKDKSNKGYIKRPQYTPT